MNRFDSEEHEPIGKWILETGLESPKSDFHTKTLQALTSRTGKKAYEPVISSGGLRWIGIGLLSFFTSVLIYMPPTSTQQNIWNQLSSHSFFNHSISIPRDYINLPDFGLVFNLSISFFSLLAFSLVLLKSIRWRFD